ncbi:MAG: 1,4-alpha-glucan branching protein domain-containing protein [Armatimonadota bacterium]
MEKGYLSLILHAHLPFVRHPEYSDSFEENRFFESITETYLPLLRAYEKLAEEGVDFKLTMTISPPLMEMMADSLLLERYTHHLELLIELAEKETLRLKNDETFRPLARIYLEEFKELHDLFVNKYHKKLINAFKKFQDRGNLEIITCGATHGFLPLLSVNPQAVRAQVKIGADNYRKHMGRSPRGIWLPECGYYPGLEQYLKEEGIRFFITDTHGVLYAKPRPKYGVYAPIYTKAGVAAFGRDVESSKQVWSAEEGYPGDYDYRDFYKDIGFDLDLDYIKPYIHESGERVFTGIKYHKITDKKSKYKQPYNFHAAREKAASHAGNFMFNREKQVEHLYGLMKRKPIIIAPYDAELYGHWWYEGPQWIYYLCKKMHHDQNTVKLTTPFEYLEKEPKNQVCEPNLSSWGHKGYCDVWLEGSNDWIYRHLHKAAERMVEMANVHKTTNDEIIKRTLNQAARELLLAQSSDWAFIMKTGTVVEYAHRRTKEHINNFTKLYNGVTQNNINTYYLKELEHKNNIFNEIDFKVYA